MVSLLVASLVLLQPTPMLDVTYRKVGQTELKMDFYPPVAAPSEPAPLVVVLHGGAWISGNKRDMAELCEILSREGFAAATVQYRLAPAAKWPSQLDDAQAAIRALRARAKEFNIDPNRIGAAGASAGAHLSLLLGSRDTRDTTAENQNESSRVRAVLNLFGPTDFNADFEPFLAGLIAQQLMGKKIDQADKEMKDGSPVNWITKGSAPIFTIHGTADQVVPVKQSARLDEACRKAGVEHVLRLIPDLGHENPTTRPKGLEAMMEAFKWLRKNLAKPASK